jgi:hypothetical protein
MPYTVEYLEDNLGLLVTWAPPLDFFKDPATIFQLVAEFHGIAQKPYFYITDTRQLGDLTLDNVIDSMATLRKHFSSIPVETLLVGSGPFLKDLLAFAQQKQYGELAGKIFATPEEAKTHIKAQSR